jgi:hypothetical protein
VEPPTSSIVLATSGGIKAGRHLSVLLWSGVTGTNVDVYRDGALIKTTENDGKYANLARYASAKGTVAYQYRVCAAGTTSCSNISTTSFAK